MRPNHDPFPKIPKGSVYAIVFILGVGLTVLASAAEIVFPRLTGRVVDDAEVLSSPIKTKLEALLKSHEEQTSDQLVIVTLKSLQGQSIEDFGYQLGRHWEIGQKDTNNGVLLIVAPNERKVRIEVGYGLEGILTDAISKSIIDKNILPEFRAGDMSRGIVLGTQAIVRILEREGSPGKSRSFLDSFFSVGTLIFLRDLILWLLAILTTVALFVVMRFSHKNKFWWQYSNVNKNWRGNREHPNQGSGDYLGGSGGFGGGGGSFGGGGASGGW